jgi:hypothetical protein
MINNLQRMQEEHEFLVPPELEKQLLTQVNHMNVFGRVVELFIPNALQTAARIIGGSAEQGPADFGDNRQPDALEDLPEWRIPPARGSR